MQLSSQTLSLSEKLNLLADAAKYDVACTSSGVNRAGKQGHLGNSVSCGICHSFSSDGRCISLLKILQSNDCIYDCKYCVNRAGNDRQRATFTPEEVCTLVTEFYRRNYIEGLFLSSAVCKNPAHTMELMYRTLHLLRNRYRFNGYIHVKAIPGAPVELIEKTGYLADRMSVNLELPTGEGLQKLAPQKTQKAILKPMRQIQSGIVDYRLTAGKSAFLERSSGNRYLSHSIFDTRKQISASAADLGWISSSSARSLPEKERSAPFVPAGQSTQMIIGATKENDYQLLSTSQLLYQQYDLKRVFYSAYIPVNEDSALPSRETKPPLLREHRLYQADWLLRFYGFKAKELLDEQHQSFHPYLDPKCNWALNHLDLFPVEVNKASYETLLRVPGIGVKGAKKIITARRTTSLTFQDLKRLGVVLKRAQYFLLCKGKMMEGVKVSEDMVLRSMMSDSAKSLYYQYQMPQSVEQLSFFEQPKLTQEDVQKCLTGQL